MVQLENTTRIEVHGAGGNYLNLVLRRDGDEDLSLELTGEQIQMLHEWLHRPPGTNSETTATRTMIVTVEPLWDSELDVDAREWEDALRQMSLDDICDEEPQIEEVSGVRVAFCFGLEADTLNGGPRDEDPVVLSGDCVATTAAGSRGGETAVLRDEILATARLTVLLRDPLDHARLAQKARSLV